MGLAQLYFSQLWSLTISPVVSVRLALVYAASKTMDQTPVVYPSLISTPRKFVGSLVSRQLRQREEEGGKGGHQKPAQAALCTGPGHQAEKKCRWATWGHSRRGHLDTGNTSPPQHKHRVKAQASPPRHKRTSAESAPTPPPLGTPCGAGVRAAWCHLEQVDEALQV